MRKTQKRVSRRFYFGQNDPVSVPEGDSGLDVLHLRQLRPILAAPALLAAGVEGVVVVGNEELDDVGVDVDGPRAAVQRWQLQQGLDV